MIKSFFLVKVGILWKPQGRSLDTISLTKAFFDRCSTQECFPRHNKDQRYDGRKPDKRRFPARKPTTTWNSPWACFHTHNDQIAESFLCHLGALAHKSLGHKEPKFTFKLHAPEVWREIRVHDCSCCKVFIHAFVNICMYSKGIFCLQPWNSPIQQMKYYPQYQIQSPQNIHRKLYFHCARVDGMHVIHNSFISYQSFNSLLKNFFRFRVLIIRVLILLITAFRCHLRFCSPQEKRGDNPLQALSHLWP